MSEIQWVAHRQIVGFRRNKNEGNEAYAWIPGEMLATRNNGEEILFASTPTLSEETAPADVPKEPAAWIPISDFSVNPFCLAYPEDFVEDEDLPQRPSGRGPIPMPGGAEGPRRRGK